MLLVDVWLMLLALFLLLSFVQLRLVPSACCHAELTFSEVHCAPLLTLDVGVDSSSRLPFFVCVHACILVQVQSTIR
jgi:hypothetical protein